MKTNTARLITWTDRDGITNVSRDMPAAEALELAKDLREANPVWCHIDVEYVDENGIRV